MVRFGTPDSHLWVWEEIVLVKENFVDCEIRFTHRHGDLESSLPVSGGVQNLIWTLLREKIQLDKLRVIEYKLNLRAASLD